MKSFIPTTLAVCVATLCHIQSVYAEEQSPVIVLPMITVYAEQENVPASNTSISQNDMQKMAVTNMADIIKYLPLVSSPSAYAGSGNVWDGTGTTGYNIRGIDGNRVALDVDGIELPEAGSKPASMKTNTFAMGRDYIDPEMFKSINIQSGATDAKSDGFGGRVSFISKSPADYLNKDKSLYGAYKFAFNSANQSKNHTITTAAGNQTLQSLAVYTHRNGKQTKPNSQITDGIPLDWTSDAVLGRLLWNFNDNQQLDLTIDHYQRTSDTTNPVDIFSDPVSMIIYSEGSQQHQDIKRTRYSLNYQYNNAQNTIFDTLNSLLYIQDSKYETITQAKYKKTSKRLAETYFSNKDIGLNIDLQKENVKNRLEYGINLLRAEQQRPWSQTTIDATGKATVNSSSVLPKIQTDKISAYLRDTLYLDIADHTLHITPELRAVYQKSKADNLNNYLPGLGIDFAANEVKSTSNHYLAPGLTIDFALTPQFLSYLKFNHNERLPTVTEKAGSFEHVGAMAILGNPNLKKESSNAYEIGLKGQIGTGISLSLAGFYTQYKDYIEYGNIVEKLGTYTIFRPDNIADANIWGAEFSSQIDLSQYMVNANGFSLGLAAGTLKNNAKEKDGTPMNLNSVLPAKGSVRFSYDAPNDYFGISFISTFAKSKQLADAAQGGHSQSISTKFKVPGYTVFDVNSYWNINKYATVNIAFNNIFDKKYWDFSTVGSLSANQTYQIENNAHPGRNITASLELKF